MVIIERRTVAILAQNSRQNQYSPNISCHSHLESREHLPGHYLTSLDFRNVSRVCNRVVNGNSREWCFSHIFETYRKHDTNILISTLF